MELQSSYKYGIDTLIRQRRDLLLSAAKRTSFLEQETKDANIQVTCLFNYAQTEHKFSWCRQCQRKLCECRVSELPLSNFCEIPAK